RTTALRDTARILILLIIGPAPAEISPFSLHDALPILAILGLQRHCLETDRLQGRRRRAVEPARRRELATLHVPKHLPEVVALERDRKSTRLNSSHLGISYAVFCLKKKS